ncbi:hypothetical protein [Sphingomonas sp. 10B4]|uniref:hypothetical protein n=1 Tax=Sphingomonas sp. 10B4 TaxID=3048575 RepID=UPI002AB5D98D|nr:hypothetical protein [Sphingomonas sp. 10B4]MDY7524758.1 hypothetical protein [Sphingomonas sp. 10B4]
MIALRGFLVAAWIVLITYTGVVVARHGLGFLPVFFDDIASGHWPGQFNLDFSCLLLLAALWTAWRNSFSGVGMVLAIIAFVGGAGFLLPYLAVLTITTRGNMASVLLGPARASRV